ncbi:MAG TPA: RluA family pseudouridine synthase [Holophaga sp.]|nr:RluA family pseudouridine synthase [Holophaga sp.]HPS67896.1 RluA family pseudouridine synthase [Holophaga sp.]
MNHGFTYTGRVGPEGDGRPVLDHLADHYAHTPRNVWSERIEAGLVLLDGRPAAAEEELRRGQQLSWLRPPWEEPPVPLACAVLFEDEDLLAVAKPSGLPTLPGGGYLEHTLLALVRCRCPEASPVHRLGRGTSGVVLFARGVRAGRNLCGALREHQMIKIYRALVQGSPALDSFLVDTPIGSVPHPFLGSVHAAHPQGKPSRSHVRVLERRSTDSLVEVRIETGRPHQIRIHMASCGHPLAGDPLYAPGGCLREDRAALPGDIGYFLHALSVTLPHPRSGARLVIECQPPPILRRTPPARII